MVSIIPKTTKKSPKWHKIAFYVSCGLFIAVVLAYAALFYFEGKTFEKVQDVEEMLAKVGTKEEKAIEKEILTAKRKISSFSSLLQKHKESSNFFTFLEESAHPKVWFSKVDLTTENSEALVGGQAASFEVLGQQLIIFQQQELIQSIDLSNLLIGKDGEVEFSFYLYLNPKIFQ